MWISLTDGVKSPQAGVGLHPSPPDPRIVHPDGHRRATAPIEEIAEFIAEVSPGGITLRSIAPESSVLICENPSGGVASSMREQSRYLES
jgi:hypothetical protein